MSIISIFTYRLPKELAIPIFSEFESRKNEAGRIISNYPRYSALTNSLDTVELLLALSIFYKRVLCNLDAAFKFRGMVANNSSSEVVRIGSYKLTYAEANRLQSLLISYRKIMAKYRLKDELWNYDLTIEFLRILIDLKKVDDARDAN